ncbi:MAG: NAD(P)H-dependent oxidoreductase, partial [Paludibacteraceae bacterium]|nr:NAD(P)H-dependent oxidoreductase [Paludibacteraceae bacterium]
MKLLIINGSPRKKGLISKMLRVFHEQAINSGIEVSEVYANDLQIKPCMGCMA